MRIVFLGHGPFGIPALEALNASAQEVVQVVTRPDKPGGRHMEVVDGPIKAAALRLGLPVMQSPDVNAQDFVELLRSWNADLLVVVDFGQILKPDCLAATKHGGINIHGSLLPKYRGAAPIVWAVWNGEERTGVTIIHMTPKMDAGEILAQRSIAIGPGQTSGDVEKDLSQLGGEMIVDAVELIESGKVKGTAQDLSLVTKARKITKEDGLIAWTQRAIQICNHICAMNPWPLAYSHWVREGHPPMRFQILQANVVPSEPSADFRPGSVLMANGSGIVVQAGHGAICINRLKPAGKKEMDAATFLRGNHLKPGDRFE